MEHLSPSVTGYAPGAAQRLRILLLAPQPFYQDRGTPIAIRSLLETLVAAGFEVDLLTYHEGADVLIPNCTIHRIPSLPGLTGIRPGFSAKKVVCDILMFTIAARLMARLRPDLVHAVEESALMALALRRLFGTPYVYDMDSSLVEQLRDRFPLLGRLEPIHRRLESLVSLVIRRSAGTLVVCRALEDLVRAAAPDHLVGLVEDTSLIPTGGTSVAEPLPPAIAAAGPVVMYVGNLEPYQGMDLLLGGFRLAAGAISNAQLVVIGGAQKHVVHYRRLALEYGIQEQTHFLGPRPVDQLAGLLVQADVLVSPRTKGTNTPMKIFSYLDSGVPVVATRLPTHTQVLDDEIAMLVAPVPEDLAGGLITLLRDPGRRAALAAAARARVWKAYTPEAARAKVHAFYHAVLTRLRPAMGTPNPGISPGLSSAGRAQRPGRGR